MKSGKWIQNIVFIALSAVNAEESTSGVFESKDAPRIFAVFILPYNTVKYVLKISIRVIGTNQKGAHIGAWARGYRPTCCVYLRSGLDSESFRHFGQLCVVVVRRVIISIQDNNSIYIDFFYHVVKLQRYRMSIRGEI
jgi:hypothetical protein